MTDDRIRWVRGPRHAGPTETIGVLELKADDSCRAVFAERVEVDGRCHIRLARQVWEGKDSLDTRWWSLVLDSNHKVFTIRNGSCGDAVLEADVPRIVAALATRPHDRRNDDRRRQRSPRSSAAAPTGGVLAAPPIFVNRRGDSCLRSPRPPRRSGLGAQSLPRSEHQSLRCRRRRITLPPQ